MVIRNCWWLSYYRGCEEPDTQGYLGTGYHSLPRDCTQAEDPAMAGATRLCRPVSVQVP